jgi:hypothetical protein
MSPRERFWNFVGRFDPFAKGSLSARDLMRYPIWEYAIDTEGLPWRDETWRRPLKRNTVPWNKYSLTVAATMTIRAGQHFDGDAYVTTADGTVDVPMGGIRVGKRWFFIPTDNPLESQARKDLAAALGLRVEEVFPIHWQLKVPLEGESALRTGEFTGGTGGE